MAIAPDVLTNATTSAAGDWTVSHAASSTARAAVVQIANGNTYTENDITGVTYGGVPMTLLIWSPYNVYTGSLYRRGGHSIWFLDGIAGGTQDVVATSSGAVEKAMVITTTPSIEGKRIRQYLGVVTGEAVMGANVFRDLFAGIRDIVGGRSGGYEKELKKARNAAFEDLEEAAQSLGANAVVGVDIDYEVLGEKNGMLMVSVSGTAVTVE